MLTWLGKLLLQVGVEPPLLGDRRVGGLRLQRRVGGRRRRHAHSRADFAGSSADQTEQADEAKRERKWSCEGRRRRNDRGVPEPRALLLKLGSAAVRVLHLEAPHVAKYTWMAEEGHGVPRKVTREQQFRKFRNGARKDNANLTSD